MIAPNDSDHSEPGGDSSDESAMTCAPTEIGVIEAAYHDGAVAGVAAVWLDRAGAARAWQRRAPPRILGGLAAGIRERPQVVMRLFVSGVFSWSAITAKVSRVIS